VGERAGSILRNYTGVIRYGDQEDLKAKVLKIQYQKGINTYSVRVPYKIVEHHKWRPHQQFTLSSGKGFIQFNPFTYWGGSTLIGVAEAKKTGFNLPIKQTQAVTENETTN
jgi:hypothetical protein